MGASSKAASNRTSATDSIVANSSSAQDLFGGQKARGAPPEPHLDTDSGYAGDCLSQAATSPTASVISQTRNFHLNNIGRTGQLARSSSSAPSPCRGETQNNTFANYMLSLGAGHDGIHQNTPPPPEPVDMLSLLSKPYHDGLRGRLTMKSLPGLSNYKPTDTPGHIMGLQEARAMAKVKKRKIKVRQRYQANPTQSHRVAATNQGPLPFLRYLRGMADGQVVDMVDADLPSGPGLQAGPPNLKPAADSLPFLMFPATAPANTGPLDADEDEGNFTSYDWPDSFTWIAAHHNRMTAALSQPTDPFTTFPTITPHALALWGLNLPSTHNPVVYLGRVPLPDPPALNKVYSMRHAPRDEGPTPTELDDAVEDYLEGLSNEQTFALIEETDFLLTALRWGMSLSTLTQCTSRRFTVFVRARRPAFIDAARWGLLHAWLDRQCGSTATQVWEKPGVEEGWDVVVPAGTPSWLGEEEVVSVERTGREWNPHPQDLEKDVAWGRGAEGWESRLERDQEGWKSGLERNQEKGGKGNKRQRSA